MTSIRAPSAASGTRPGRALSLGLFIAAIAGGAAACSDAHIKLLEPPQTLRIPDGGKPDQPVVKEPEAGPPAVDIEALRRSACERSFTTGEREQALLMMVIDVSNSMSMPFGSAGSRWDAQRPILTEAVTAMPSTIGLGALYYPNMATPASTQPRPASACVNTQALIPVNLLGASDSRHRGRIQRSLSSMQPNPQAGTPTLDAYLVGLSALGSSTLEGSRQMLLITDGQPTFSEGCVGTGDMSAVVDPGPVISVVDAARRAGVRTYVIGSPGSEGALPSGGDSRTWLSTAAEAGGTARANCSSTGPRYCHFDLTSEPDFAGGLRSALSEIEDRLMRCEFFFTDDRDLLGEYALNLVLTMEDGTQTLLPTATSENCTQGWHYSDDKKRVVLCADTCTALRSQNQALLEFLFFGCVQSGRP